MATAAQPLTQQQDFDPVGELRKRYPGVAQEPDEKIIQHLSNPQNFRAAFPEYEHLDDETITRNMARHAQSSAATPAQPQGFLGRVNEFAKKALSAAGLPTSISDVPDWAKRLTGQTPDSEPFWAPIKKAIANPTQKNIVGAVPIIGAPSVEAAKDVREGNYAGAAGTLVGTIAPFHSAGQIKPGLTAAAAEAKPIMAAARKVPGAVGDAASKVVYNAEGKMRPSVRTAARVVGAAGGHFTGIPGMEVVGAVGGPSVLDAVTPAREPTVAKAVPITRSPYYQQHLEAKATEQSAARAAEAADAEARKAVPITQSPHYAEIEKAKAAKVAPVISRPGPEGPRFTGNEGRPATWTNERVLELAKQGNRDAIAQAGRRGLPLPENARYVAGDIDYPRVVYNPREVTRFGPDGTPIRQGGSTIKPVAKPFSGAKPEPQYAYRVHDATLGPEEMDLERSHAHATMSEQEAKEYQGSRNAGTPQAISKTDLSKLKEGVDYEFIKGPRGNQWVKFKTARAKAEFEPFE